MTIYTHEGYRNYYFAKYRYGFCFLENGAQKVKYVLENGAIREKSKEFMLLFNSFPYLVKYCFVIVKCHKKENKQRIMMHLVV